MGGQLGEGVHSNGRLTIGFLDETTYFGYHNLIISGINKAARKYGINILRFSHFSGNVVSKNEAQETTFLNSIGKFKLDGLIYLGWASSLTDKDLRNVYPGLPLVCLGKEHKEIPSAYFPGENYVKEIILHLINAHHYKNIAFITPYRHDPRVDCYLETMKEYGIYNPSLFVDEPEMQSLDIYERGLRAIQILLDERNIKVEAIVSLYCDETYAIFNELKRRGIRIPEDIALTSYEDGEAGRFSSPALTTVYFPWKEMGYFACETLYNHLTGGQIPLLTNIPGRIIYRGSCGCIPDLVKTSRNGSLQSSAKNFEELCDDEFDSIINTIASETAMKHSEIEGLIKSFRQAFRSGDTNTFLMEIEGFLRKIGHSRISSETSAFAATLRRHFLPYFLPYSSNDANKLIWAEDTFLQVQVILQNKLANISFKEDVNQKDIRLKLKVIGQILIANFTVTNLLDSLEINLPRLKINSCYIYLFGKDGNSINLDESRLVFEYSASKRIETSNDHHIGLDESLRTLMREDGTDFLTVHLLHKGDDLIGLVLFEPTYMDMGIYQSIAMQLSAAFNGIMLFEKLDDSYRRLMDQAHKKGMADISTGILHNIGNILNSVNITTHSLSKLLEVNAIDDLTKANTLLKSRFDDLDDFIRLDPKGKTLMQFYVSLTDTFEDFRIKFQDNLDRLSGRIQLIDEIITAQQSYTAVKSNLKPVDVVAIIENVLKMNQNTIEKLQIQVDRHFGRIVLVLANGTKLFHILTNLVKNAIEAMEPMPSEKRKLSLEVIVENEKISLRVSDSGNGIDPSHLESIFAYGFTTKENGHGFGLHSCANYMTEMNGRLWAESAGAGLGATFVLELKRPEELVYKS